MSTGKVILGTVAGLAIGVAAGILFAPEKGSTIRKRIMDKCDDCIDVLKSKSDKFVDSTSEKFESTKNDAEKIVEKAKEKYDNTKKDFNNSTSNFKHGG